MQKHLFCKETVLHKLCCILKFVFFVYKYLYIKFIAKKHPLNRYKIKAKCFALNLNLISQKQVPLILYYMLYHKWPPGGK